MKLPICSMWLAILTVAMTAQSQSNRSFDVREFRAKGDGKTLDTAAIQRALDACGEAGGGVVRLSSGTYLSQPIYLRDKTTLQLDRGAILQATDNPAHYVDSRRLQSRLSMPMFPANPSTF